MRTGRIRRLGIGVLLTISLAISTARFLRSSTDTLLRNARHVGTAYPHDAMAWISNHEFIVVNGFNGSTVHGIRHDIETGKQTPVNETTPSSFSINPWFRFENNCWYTSESLGPKNSLNINVWDQRKIDAALAKKNGTVTLISHSDSIALLTRNSLVRWYHNVDLTPVRSFTIVLPAGAQQWPELLLSRQGDRWAAIVSGRRAETFPAWLRRLLPRWTKQDTVSIYTGRTDGTGTHSLGSVMLASSVHPRPWVQAQVKEQDAVTALHWLPDGRHLSFIYKNALYVTSAD